MSLHQIGEHLANQYRYLGSKLFQERQRLNLAGAKDCSPSSALRDSDAFVSPCVWTGGRLDQFVMIRCLRYRSDLYACNVTILNCHSSIDFPARVRSMGVAGVKQWTHDVVPGLPKTIIDPALRTPRLCPGVLSRAVRWRKSRK